MNLLLNGQPHTFQGETVDELLLSLSLSPDGVAIAVNRTIIPRSDLGLARLSPDDHVEIVKASPGG
ncbi:sulfur carrier protein ThiS [bacterium]|nr:sulfur carrier protein ThiS [bacterium]